MAEDCPCEGGWRHLSEDTIAHDFPEPVREADEDDATFERRHFAWRNAVAMARNTWYPCREHNASKFWRWVNGHWNSDHDRAGCVDCTEIARQRRGGRPRRTEHSELAEITNYTEPKERDF